MTLDVRTIVVLLILSSVLMTVTLSVGIRAGRGFGFSKWNAGLGLYALGWLLIATRGALPDVVAMAGADALLLSGLCLQLAAVIEFDSGVAPRWLLIAPGPLLFLATLPLLGNYGLFTFVASVSYTVSMAAIAIAASRTGAHGGPARWMLAAGYGAGALILLVRAALVLFDPAARTGLFAPSLIHTATFTAMFALTATGSMAFLLMLRERAEAEIRRLALVDPLTGLLNRRAFVELAERELARARRARGPVSVLMMDLDYFKRVNDRFGHQAGDRVLAEFAATVRRSLRTEDLVGRYGGEEFCALLPGANLQQAVESANRVRLAVAAHPLGGLPAVTTVSIGVAACAGAAAWLDPLVARADEALYQAKAQGRDRVVALPLGDPKSSDGQSSAIRPPKLAAADVALAQAPAH
jgi:diguanylate cyclase (GGDEF)-like protein